ncbi:MAG: MFS transporter [Eggerthellaceae bacterium]
MIIENFNVSIAFNIVGVFCIVGFIVLSRFLKMPAADFKPEGWNPPAESDTKRVKNYTSGQMLKTPFFWTLLLFFGTVACTGCVMLSTVSLVGQVQAGMDAATGALMVGIFAIANGTGRLGLGAISDKLGRFQTMFVAVAVTAVIHLFLFANATSTAIFIVEACILGICFGGIMAIMPSVCADAYGPGNAGQNYGFMFIGYTLASFIGPVVSANALATTGSYSSAFPFLGALCIVGLVLLSLAWMFFKKMKAKDAAEA